MSLHSREMTKHRALRPIYTNAQIALLFITILSALALVINWNGTPDVLVEGICAGSALLLLVLSLINRKRAR